MVRRRIALIDEPIRRRRRRRTKKKNPRPPRPSQRRPAPRFSPLWLPLKAREQIMKLAVSGVSSEKQEEEASSSFLPSSLHLDKGETALLLLLRVATSPFPFFSLF